MATVRISGNALIIEKFTFLCLFISLTIGSALGFFVVTPNDTLAILGDSTQLNCSYTVDGDAAWRKGEGTESRYITEGRDSRHDDPHYEVVGDVDSIEYNLRILNIQEEHEDIFECSDLYEFGNVAPARLYIISDPPKCSVYPNNVLKVGENATFSCTIDLDANAPGELVWFLNGTEIYREEGQSSTVNLTVDIPDKGAVIDCQIQHYTLPSWKWSSVSCEEKITMDIQYLSDFNMTVAPNTNITEGETVLFQCLATGGNPGTDNMTLTLQGKIIAEDQKEIRVTYNITGSDSGVYQCEAFTTFYDGSVHHWVEMEEIIVYYSPDISAEENEFEAPLGSFVELVCTAKAFPTPTITWIDSDDDAIPGNEEDRNITTFIPDETTVTSTLTVTVVDKSYYGIYTCKASNEIPPSVQLSMRILEPGDSSVAGIVTFSLVAVGGVAVVIVAVYMCKRSHNKKQGSGNDNESSGLNDVVEQNADMGADNRLEPEGLSNDHTINNYAETAPSTISSVQAPEAAYAVSVKQKRTSSKKSTNETGQNMTGESNPDPAGLYAVSSKQKDSHEKKEKPKGELTYAELDLTNSGSKQQQNKPPEAEKTQYASIQIPKTD